MPGQQRAYFMGPQTERWRPSSWEDVVAAASSGVLDETRWVELKEDVPASNAKANLELAKDLASLSAEGAPS